MSGAYYRPVMMMRVQFEFVEILLVRPIEGYHQVELETWDEEQAAHYYVDHTE